MDIVMDNKRLTWDEIVQTYPNQQVGLSEVEWDNEATVKSAIVAYTEETTPRRVIISIAMLSGGSIVSENTTQDTTMHVGAYTVC